MLYHVHMQVHPPTDGDPATFERLKAAEKERAQDLQQSGKWLHLWRIAGQYANISVFDVPRSRPAARDPVVAAVVPVHGDRGDAARAASLGDRLSLGRSRSRIIAALLVGFDYNVVGHWFAKVDIKRRGQVAGERPERTPSCGFQAMSISDALESRCPLLVKRSHTFAKVLGRPQTAITMALELNGDRQRRVLGIVQ